MDKINLFPDLSGLLLIPKEIGLKLKCPRCKSKNIRKTNAKGQFFDYTCDNCGDYLRILINGIDNSDLCIPQDYKDKYVYKNILK